MLDLSCRRPVAAALEATGLVLGVELLLWSDAGADWGVRGIALALVGGALAASFRRRGLASRLPARQGALSSWAQVAGVTLIAALVVLLLSRVLGVWGDAPLHFDAAAFASWGDLVWWLGKLVTVVAQQLLLQLCLLPLCIEISGRTTRGLLLAGLVFGAVHLPNPTLSLFTACAAPLWCALFLRTGRLVPLLASHLLLAILVRAACGDAIYNMRVGAGVLPLLPRVIVAQDGSHERVTPRSLEGFLDVCSEAGESLVVCRGWSADIDRRRPSDALLVLGGGSWHRLTPTRTPRPDVVLQLGLPELNASGFEVELPLHWFQQSSEPRFFGVSGEQVAELEYHSERRWTRD